MTDKEWKKQHGFAAKTRVFRRGDKRLTAKMVREENGMSNQAALRRLIRWERGDITLEDLYAEPRKQLRVAKTHKGRPKNSTNKPRSELLDRIPEPSDLERRLFG
jgi:hypothetical protein